MITLSGDRGTLAGPVTLANVNAVLAEGNRLFSVPAVTLDLAGVTEVDSTAVSLLLEWRRTAQSAARKITYTNYPENLKSLIALYGITELLN